MHDAIIHLVDDVQLQALLAGRTIRFDCAMTTASIGDVLTVEELVDREGHTLSPARSDEREQVITAHALAAPIDGLRVEVIGLEPNEVGGVRLTLRRVDG